MERKNEMPSFILQNIYMEVAREHANKSPVNSICNLLPLYPPLNFLKIKKSQYLMTDKVRLFSLKTQSLK